MKFKYQNYGSYKPVIPITIASKDGKVFNYEALVDSGADKCIFDAQIGKIIGLDVEKGDPEEVLGVSGNKIKVYYHEIDIAVGGHEYRISCGFSNSFAKVPFGILGHIGFFEHFKIIFDYSKKVVELRQK